jgi:hypothetical protein
MVCESSAMSWGKVQFDLDEVARYGTRPSAGLLSGHTLLTLNYFLSIGEWGWRKLKALNHRETRAVANSTIVVFL